jgi:purine-binding chemotaxis protein CheW
MSEAVVFTLDQRHYGLPLDCAERVVRAVEISPLPGGPASVLGTITILGEKVPVLNMRRLFALPEREIDPDDQFIVMRVGARRVVLAVDEAIDVTASEVLAMPGGAEPAVLLDPGRLIGDDDAPALDAALAVAGRAP